MTERSHREHLLNAGIVLLVNVLLLIVLPFFMMAQKVSEPVAPVPGGFRIVDFVKSCEKKPVSSQQRSNEDIQPPKKHEAVAPEHLTIPLQGIRLTAPDISFEPISLDIDPCMETCPVFTLPDNESTIAYDQFEVDQVPMTVVKTPPVYPYRARRLNLSGKVHVKFLVDTAGQVHDIRIIEASPPDVFDKSVIDALSSWSFTPGRLQGRPVATIVTTTIVFRLEDAG